MTMTRRLRTLLLVPCASVTAPLALSAQEPPPPPPPAQQQELVAEREVFTYPAAGRRNPFKPLTSGYDGAPRFDQLRLMGIVFSEDPSASVAVLGTSTVQISEDGSQVSIQEGNAWYLKVGQSLGNIRVVEIRREQVVVDVEEFGLTERKIMQLQTRRLGGAP
jgi:hypothetical protein